MDENKYLEEQFETIQYPEFIDTENNIHLEEWLEANTSPILKDMTERLKKISEEIENVKLKHEALKLESEVFEAENKIAFNSLRQRTNNVAEFFIATHPHLDLCKDKPNNESKDKFKDELTK